ncbi:Egg cell-secreted protein 1.1 [Sesamum angolense]|uniref:Egg cell-secreted protein 1.1 n=1 Tax=Sesamum angolense TaxID=2727404 RepID=A0AAE1XH05_9LAMI|nr:Egg cell-secreted protein 1.1 [Sesamum angolense]
MTTMADSTFKLLPIALLLCLSASATGTTARMLQDSRLSTSLSARLKLDEGSSNSCWESLFQLQSCTAEVVLFFLNGEAYLGPGCCRAIWIIQHECWPQMLASLGYTPEEADILRGYCDATEAGGSARPPPPPPPPRRPN